MLLHLIPESTTVLLPPSADTSTYQDSGGTNYGTSTTLQIGGYSSYYMRSYLKFNLSSLAGKTITSAKLKLYKHYVNTYGESVTFSARRITADWDEMGLTYNNAPAYSAAYGSIYTFGPINAWSEIDLKTMLQEWIDGTYPNYGVCLSYEATGYRYNSTWRSKEYSDPAYRPYLEIVVANSNPTLEGSSIFGPYDLSILEQYESSLVNMTANAPEGSTIQLFSAITDDTNQPITWSEQTPGAEIEALTQGQSLISKYLWFKVAMTRSTLLIDPQVTALSFSALAAENTKQIQINLTDAGRLKYPQGDTTLNFTGSIIGILGSSVDPFIQSFTPVNIIPIFNPNDREHLSASALMSLHTHEITFTSKRSGYEYLSAKANNMTIVVTNIGGVPL